MSPWPVVCSAIPKLLAGLALVSSTAAASAQTHRQPELRIDVVGPSPFSVQPGIGANVALGHYARISANIGYALTRDTNQIADRWRADLLGRFVLDPFRQQRWGLAVGGGLSIRRRTYIAALLELEGPEVAGWLPALQAGVSGGFRAGLVMRRAIKGRR